MGLVNAVVPHDKLDAEVDKWCAEIRERSPTAHRHRQALVQRRHRAICAPSARSASRRWRCSTAPRSRRRAAAPSARSARRSSASKNEPVRSKAFNEHSSSASASPPIRAPGRSSTAAVKPDGIDLMPTVLHPSELFWRQLRFAEFDVVRDVDLVADDGEVEGRRPLRRHPGVHHAEVLPHHACWCARTPRSTSPPTSRASASACRNISRPRRCGSRGVLQHEFGVEPKDMEFWMERPPSRSHGGATGFKPPPGVTVNQIPPDKSIGSMMVSGELDAVMLLSGRSAT